MSKITVLTSLVAAGIAASVLAEGASAPSTAAKGASATAGAAATRGSSRGYTPYYESDASGSGFYDEWIKGKLSIGLTVSTFSLTDNHRPPNRQDDFLGNINDLSGEHKTGVAPTISWRLFDYLLVGASYTRIEARTMNFNNHESDGNATLKGPVFTAEFTYPLLEETLFPHVGLGYAALSGDFDEDAWWHAGYANPTDYDRLGRDNNRYRKHRYIDVDNDSCVFFGIGVSYKPIEHLMLDVSYRKLSLDPDCRFGYKSGSRKSVENTGDFDMSCNMFLFSVSYLF